MEKSKSLTELLQKRAELSAKLSLIPYEGSIEIKTRNNNKYIYLRKKTLNKNSSIYIDKYSDELFSSISSLLLQNRFLKKEITKVNRQLAVFGFSELELPPRVLLNVDFAKINMKSNIYNQAILEGIATTFLDTETIIDNGKVNSMKPSDIQKILNLKHAWQFVTDKDIVSCSSDHAILCYIARLVNEGFYLNGGNIRTLPVSIGGTDYVPPIPNEQTIKSDIDNILSSNKPVIDRAIDVCLFVMKKQVFNDGNKRASVIFANHFMIRNGTGLLIIPESKIKEFKQLLINYYEDKDSGEITEFMKKFCWKTF